MTTGPLKKRLSAHDAVFLHWERAEQPFHVCECMVYAGKVTAADMKRMLEERMHLLPRYRQRIVFTPLDFDHHTWEDDPEFDLDRHIAESELPAPAGDREISTYCGELFCQLLDREHPLWHMTVIHGHTSGNTVVFLKLHHAMVDGVSSVELIEVLHDTKPSNSPPSAPTEDWQPNKLPGEMDLIRAAVADRVEAGFDIMREMTNLLRPGGIGAMADRVALIAKTSLDAGKLLLQSPPETPFNKPISAARHFCWLELPLQEVHKVRKAHNATVNDMVLAILSGALGRYMRRQGFDTNGVELRSMCPVSVRTADQRSVWQPNIHGCSTASCWILNPVERLDAEIRSMRELKDKTRPAASSK